KRCPMALRLFRTPRSRLWLGLALVTLLGKPSGAEAQVPFSAVHGISAAAYQNWLNRMAKEGVRPVHVSVCSMGGAAPQFAAVALKDGKNTPYVTRHGLTAPQYADSCGELNKKGLRVLSVSGYRQGSATRFAAVWVKDGARWQGRHDLLEK